MFGENLHKIMKAQNISGKELSQSTGISQSTISKFLSGNQEPNYSQIIQLAKALHIPPGVFVCIINCKYDTAPPMINECCIIREIFRDASSNLHIATLHSFKKFTMDLSDMIHDEAIYVSVVLKGGTDSKLGSLRPGEYRIFKGTQYRDVKLTVHKDTIAISYMILDSQEDITRSWLRIYFDGLKQKKTNFLN